MTEAHAQQALPSVLPFDAEHQAVWAILPWHVNGTLRGAEAARVDTHLKRCLVCRREIDLLGRLAQYTAEPRLNVECEDALRRLTLRIEQKRHARQMPWAAAAMLMVVTGLLGWVADNTDTSTAWLRNAGYSMLNQPREPVAAAHAPKVRLVFYDDVTERQLRALLLAVGADVVEGPTPQGVYTLAFAHSTSPNAVVEAIRKLRYSGRVIFAEPTFTTKVSDLANW